MKPILFNTAMVRAIQNGTKTVTRRVVKPHNATKAKRCEYRQGDGLWIEDTHIKDYSVSPCWIDVQSYIQKYSPYSPGDILYVRETFCLNNFGYHYRVDWPNDNCPDMSADDKWRPSIHMPREAARIFLRVTSVRVERLRDMPDEDLVRDFGFCWEAIQAMGRDVLAKPLWDSTIKPADCTLYGWAANPWVWVIEFEWCERPEDETI